ncbi:MAG TPA: T9SS type A sorting domain-containing protein, partial [Ignavibacteriaceae bacterium]
SRHCKVRTIFFCILLFRVLIFSDESTAQWVNNPAENTRVVFDTAEPINISAVGDQNGGAFIFWEDNITHLQNEVSFMHIESNGDISFRANGIRVSESAGDQDDPVSISVGKNNAVVCWKDFTLHNTGDLFIQKVQANGSVLWGSRGTKINSLDKEIGEYSLCANENNEVFISYLVKEPGQVFNSQLILQKISPSGKFLFDSVGIKVSGSINSKLSPVVLPDESGGAYVFWIESYGSKGVILAQRFDGTGKALWGRSFLSLTDNNLNVISISGVKSGTRVYIAYQILKKDKKIYHQLITPAGTLLWGKNGRICSNNRGSQSNQEITSSGTNLILSWTNEIKKGRDIYVQKYDHTGKPLWHEGGTVVISLDGDQFGQKIIPDGHNGAILAWLDRRETSVTGNIYSQRIAADGNILWDSAGIAIGSYFNTPKSYLNLLPDERGGAIAVFKEKRKAENGIYVQKIFNTGTFVSQIIGFSTEIVSDSVKLKWYSANETPDSFYDIERCMQTDTGNTDWRKLYTAFSDTGRAANYYEYYDKPDSSGTLYYRIILSDGLGNMLSSDISRVTFLESTRHIIVTQNTPNPFADSTVIKFYLPEESEVKIEFFDNHIEKIEEINNRFPAGENSVTFTARTRQSGIYFYKFESGDFVEVKKMVLTD